MIGKLSQEEHTAFDWFMHKNTTKLSGLFTSAFWDELVFQASAQEPAVRHAVIALSSAQKAEKLHRKSFGCHDEDDAERFTLQQYNKAIGYLREHRHSSQSAESTRIVLITCMIFVVLEFLRGRYQMGFVHLKSGIKLLSEGQSHQYGDQMSSIVLRSKDDFAQIALVDAFTRLSVHCSFYKDNAQEVLISVREGNRADPYAIPSVFASVAEARRILDRIYGRIQFLRQSYPSSSSSSAKGESPLSHTQDRILIDLKKWKSARDAFIRQLTSTHAHIRDRMCFEIMSLYHSMATIMVSVCLDPDKEMTYDSDAHIHAFACILAGCNELPQQLRLLAGQSPPPTASEPKCAGMGFSVEMGFILPAFFTAIKCRVPRMRRQALYVLRSGMNREAGWDRRVVARMVEEVIKEEEGNFYLTSSAFGLNGEIVQDLNPPTLDDFAVPRIESFRRLRDVSIILPDDLMASTLTFKRRTEDGGWITCSRQF